MLKVSIFAVLEISSQIRQNTLIWTTHCVWNNQLSEYDEWLEIKLSKSFLVKIRTKSLHMSVAKAPDRAQYTSIWSTFGTQHFWSGPRISREKLGILSVSSTLENPIIESINGSFSKLAHYFERVCAICRGSIKANLGINIFQLTK